MLASAHERGGEGESEGETVMNALILSCGTGGGHNSAACAIKEELIRRGNGVVMMNPYGLCKNRTAERVNYSYIRLAQNAPSCFGLLYRLGDLYRRLPFRSPVYFLNGKMVPVMEKYLEEHHFDVVIMTHLFPAEIMAQMRERGIEIPKTIFIATDYTCIPFTEETACDAYVIPAKALTAEFQRRGIPEEKIYPLGIPVRRAFTLEASKSEARKKLGLEWNRRYLLVSGGSIGAGKLERVLELLYEQCGGKGELIVICGNNKRLYRKLSKKYGNEVILLQSTDQMAAYLRACDLYLTKPGGLSSTEAAVMGGFLVHLPPIPGCETENARFFNQYGMSWRLKPTRQDVSQILKFMEEPCQKTAMGYRQQEMIPRDAAEKICDLAAEMSG